jgi:hypothetical protein
MAVLEQTLTCCVYTTTQVSYLSQQWITSNSHCGHYLFYYSRATFYTVKIFITNSEICMHEILAVDLFENANHC